MCPSFLELMNRIPPFWGGRKPGAGLSNVVLRIGHDGFTWLRLSSGGGGNIDPGRSCDLPEPTSSHLEMICFTFVIMHVCKKYPTYLEFM